MAPSLQIRTSKCTSMAVITETHKTIWRLMAVSKTSCNRHQTSTVFRCEQCVFFTCFDFRKWAGICSRDRLCISISLAAWCSSSQRLKSSIVCKYVSTCWASGLSPNSFFASFKSHATYFNTAAIAEIIIHTKQYILFQNPNNFRPSWTKQTRILTNYMFIKPHFFTFSEY